MFLTYQFAPIWIAGVSLATYFVLSFMDPINLNDYTEKMGGVPPIICCASMLFPLAVLLTYDQLLKLGPKPSKCGIKV